jgi:hypothetical protein
MFGEMWRRLLCTWHIDVSEALTVPIITTIRRDIPQNWFFIATIMIMSNVSLKFYYSYQSVTVFVIIHYVFFVIGKAYNATRGNVTQSSFLFSLQCKRNCTIRKLETRRQSSLEHYFLPRLWKYVRNIYAGIWQKLISFLFSLLFTLHAYIRRYVYM